MAQSECGPLDGEVRTSSATQSCVLQKSFIPKSSIFICASQQLTRCQLYNCRSSCCFAILQIIHEMPFLFWFKQLFPHNCLTIACHCNAYPGKNNRSNAKNGDEAISLP